jgi:hypothetical protein
MCVQDMPISNVDPDRPSSYTGLYVCQSKVGSFHILSSQLNVLPFDCRVSVRATLNEPEIKNLNL